MGVGLLGTGMGSWTGTGGGRIRWVQVWGGFEWDRCGEGSVGPDMGRVRVGQVCGGFSGTGVWKVCLSHLSGIDAWRVCLELCLGQVCVCLRACVVCVCVGGGGSV